MRAFVSSTVVGFLVIASLAAVGQTDDGREAAVREEVLRRAQVWIDPGVPIDQARLDANPPGADSFAVDADVECEFEPDPLGGSTPKFDCELENGKKSASSMAGTIRKSMARWPPAASCPLSAFPRTTSISSGVFGASGVRRIRSRLLLPE